jgi:hypothetical protein
MCFLHFRTLLTNPQLGMKKRRNHIMHSVYKKLLATLFGQKNIRNK